jgi:uncharacterized protein YjbI with pentapeptide repeats
MAEGKGTHTAEQENEPDKRLPWWKRLWRWTEFGKKSGWDFLQLLILPLMLAAIGFWFTAQQDARQQQIENQRAEAERELAEQRAQDEALQAYLDQMGSLLLEKDLRTSEDDSEVRTLAQARTVTVIQRLDSHRNRNVIRFLKEAGLTSKEQSSIRLLAGADLQGAPLEGTDLSSTDLVLTSLNGANLSGADLTGADLSGADLNGANLSNAALFNNANLTLAGLRSANLRRANLFGADLSGSTLIEANLGGANLSSANLGDAYLNNANLSDTNLSGSTLSNANLSGADLSGANLIFSDLHDADLHRANLRGATALTDERIAAAESLKGATMPNGQKYEDWLKDKEGSGKDVKNE